MTKNLRFVKNRVLSFFIIVLMVLTGFVAMAGAAQENTNEESPGTIIGKVMNVEEEPLAGIVVYLEYIVEDSENDRNHMIRQQTNERGMFEFNELRRGIYAVTIKNDHYEPWAEKVKLPAGETVELKVILKKASNEEEPEFAVVFGIVFNPLENEPIPGARISIGNEHSDRKPIVAESNREGKFEVKVPRGKFTIVVEARGFHSYKELLVVDKLEIKLEIPLKPIHDEPEPEREREREREHPILSGRIFDAETDETIMGWVELSFGNRKPQMEEPKPKRPMQDEKERPTRAEEEERVLERKREEETNNENRERERREDQERDMKRPNPEKPEDFFLWRTYSNKEGYYAYRDLPAGHYEMRVFAKGHVMYYNEINVREEPLRIDVYLLREKPVKKPFAVITGHVFDRSTKEPVAGAWVCVVPPELLRKVISEYQQETDEPMNIDLDNINFETDLETSYLDMPPEDIETEININDFEKPDMEKKPITDKPKSTDESNTKDERKTRAEQTDRPEKDRENDKNTDKPDRDAPCCDCKKRVLRKFCTRTNEKGFFKLVIPAGAHVLLVKARGYELFAHKFEIRPHQKMEVKVPLKPMTRENDKLLARTDAENKEATEGSETLSMETNLVEGTTSMSSILNSVLGVLIFIALILGAMVWRKKHKTGNKKKQ
jgi:hypothetical protein